MLKVTWVSAHQPPPQNYLSTPPRTLSVSISRDMPTAPQTCLESPPPPHLLHPPPSSLTQTEKWESEHHLLRNSYQLQEMPTSPAGSALAAQLPHPASSKPQELSMFKEREHRHSQTASTSLTDVFQHEEHVLLLEELPSTLEPPIVWHITPEHQLLILQTSL